MSKIKQWTIDNWLKILIPFLIMWGGYVTVGAVKTTLDTRGKAIIHKRISDNVDAIKELSERAEIKRNNLKLELLVRVKDKDDEVRELRRLVMDLWQVQAENMRGICGKELPSQ